MSAFWRKWMTVWCWAVFLFGVVLAGGGLVATSGPVRIIFNLLNGPGELNLDPHMHFSLGVLGAVTIGWSITLAAAIKAANQIGKDRGKPIWALITASVLSWYVIDSSLSVATGFWLNAVLNTGFIGAYLLAVMSSGVFSKVAQATTR